jgi:hypothetical protein
MPSAPKWTTGWFGTLLGLPKFRRFLAPLADSPKPLFEAAADLLDLEISQSGQEHLEGVDLSKGCIMVANHPSGLVDTFASGLWITRTTQQPARFLGNQIIGTLIPQAVPYMISVNNMGSWPSRGLLEGRWFAWCCTRGRGVLLAVLLTRRHFQVDRPPMEPEFCFLGQSRWRSHCACACERIQSVALPVSSVVRTGGRAHDEFPGVSGQLRKARSYSCGGAPIGDRDSRDVGH